MAHSFAQMQNAGAAEDAHMERCLQLARLGAGRTAPNPLVGAVLAVGKRVLAEGWHAVHGGPHAEVECLKSFGADQVPEDATLYVNLEPCAHHGLTPPCATMLVQRRVRRVVVAQEDPDPRVGGKGIAHLREAGVEVHLGVRQDEAQWTNRRFLTSLSAQRPYIILKWAQSSDGFLDGPTSTRRGVQRITGATAHTLVHRWRSEEQAILVGGRTVLRDDPQLNVRFTSGCAPLRVVLDRSGIAPAESKVFDGSQPTLLVTARTRGASGAEELSVSKDADPLPLLLSELQRRKIRSVMVEGGAELLQHFLRQELWDEARVFTSASALGKGGTPAPRFERPALRQENIGADTLRYYTRTTPVHPQWTW
jgi:diaminohydroxyphosphoribosylaminopyrimidine deaminase / 5-amino-6-(5-phosphoribosylamino)uracil reductase